MFDLVFDANSFEVHTNKQLLVTIEEVQVVTSSGTQDTVTLNDVLYDRQADATTRTDLQIYADDATFDSGDESIATVDENGYVTSIDNGEVAIYVRSRICDYKVLHNSVVDAGGQEVLTPSNFIAGSLGRHIVDAMDALIASGGSVEMFTLQNYASSIYTRNPSCWLSSIDFSGVPVGRNSSRYFTGVLISPRHLLVATHTGVSAGNEFDMVTMSNQTVTRTVTAVADYGSNSDIRIALLDSDVPASITPLKVLPENVRDYLFTLANVPVITPNQDKRAFIHDWWNQWLASGGQSYCNHKTPTDPSRLLFHQAIRGMDSGSPILLLINGELVALGTHYGISSWAPTHAHHDGINALMTSLGGGYQLTPIDLSSFTDFS